MAPVALSVLVAAVAALPVVPAVRRFAPRLGLMDVPNERSSHVRTTPRGGGLAIVLSSLMAIALFALLTGGDSALFFYATGALLVAGVSFLDDLSPRGALPRLVVHLTAAGVCALGIAPSATFSVPMLRVAELPHPLAGLALTIWIAGMTNAYNFMDGIDGIAGVQGVAAGIAWAAIGWFGGAPAVTVVGGALAAACSVFLVHNWHPASIFLGDVGSAFLGFTFAVLPLLFATGASADAAARGMSAGVIAVWPFAFDAGFTLFRRALAGENVFRAHRSHLYQRLTSTGLSHAQVSMGYGVLAVVCAGASVLWVKGAGEHGGALVLAVCVVSSVILVGWVFRRESRIRQPAVRKPV